MPSVSLLCRFNPKSQRSNLIFFALLIVLVLVLVNRSFIEYEDEYENEYDDEGGASSVLSPLT